MSELKLDIDEATLAKARELETAQRVYERVGRWYGWRTSLIGVVVALGAVFTFTSFRSVLEEVVKTRVREPDLQQALNKALNAEAKAAIKERIDPLVAKAENELAEIEKLKSQLASVNADIVALRQGQTRRLTQSQINEIRQRFKDMCEDRPRSENRLFSIWVSDGVVDGLELKQSLETSLGGLNCGAVPEEVFKSWVPALRRVSAKGLVVYSSGDSASDRYARLLVSNIREVSHLPVSVGSFAVKLPSDYPVPTAAVLIVIGPKN